MLSHQSSPRVLLSDLEYLTLKIAFNPGHRAQWYVDHLSEYVGTAAPRGGCDFISGQFVIFAPGAHEPLRGPGGVLLALEVPTSALKQEHLKDVPSSDNIRGYVITNAGLDIARDAAVKIGIDPDTIPL